MVSLSVLAALGMAIDLGLSRMSVAVNVSGLTSVFASRTWSEGPVNPHRH